MGRDGDGRAPARHSRDHGLRPGKTCGVGRFYGFTITYANNGETPNVILPPLLQVVRPGRHAQSAWLPDAADLAAENLAGDGFEP